MRIHVQKVMYKDSYDFLIMEERQGRRFIAKPFLLEEMKEGGYIQDPTFSVRGNEGEIFLQELVNQAWDLGIRPRYARETEPQVEAIKFHLEDMRSLVFKKGKA